MKSIEIENNFQKLKKIQNHKAVHGISKPIR